MLPNHGTRKGEAGIGEVRAGQGPLVIFIWGETEMAAKLSREEAQRLGLRGCRPLRGNREAWMCVWDDRLYLLRRDDGWHLTVLRKAWCYNEPPRHREGPLPTLEAALTAARSWHLDHPHGRLAELLAACDCPRGLRSLLHGVNERGVEALAGVYDLLLEAGLTDDRWTWAAEELEGIGVIPVGDDGEVVGAPARPW